MARTKDTGDYGIGAVARLTGLTDHTIRVWERRYEAVVAKRTKTGRRVYTAAHVERLGLLKQLTDRGMAIGKIAKKSTAALRKSVRELAEVAAAATADTVRVAVLGELVTARLRDNPGPLELVVASDNADTLGTDLANHSVDLVILEVTVLDPQALELLDSLVSLGGAQRGIVVYNFGRKADIDRAVRRGAGALRAPVSAIDLQAAARSLPAGPAVSPSPAASEDADTQWRFSGRTPARRFTRPQLGRLANISSAIDCECPQNLAQLVSDLTAFEIYSAQCANRDAEDAALHHYLHQTTAEARELIELALQKVVVAEGIEL